jgi:hypothetical protein
MILFISPNSFLGVGKHHGFRKKILETLGDALRFNLKTRERLARTGAHGVHGSKIIFGPWIADERCCSLLTSHS